MTLIDGDALLDTLSWEIARVAGLRLRLGRAAENWTTGRPQFLFSMDQAVDRARAAKDLGFEAQRASLAELRRFVAK